MCSLTLALAGLSTGVSALSSYQQGRQQAAAAESQAQAAQQMADAAYRNAQIQNKQREIASEQEAYKQKKLDDQLRLIRGYNAAQAGANSIAGNIGSGLDIYNAGTDAYIGDSTRLLQDMRYNDYMGLIKETNDMNQGHAYTAQASNLRAQAKAAKQAGTIGAIFALGSGIYNMTSGQGANSGSDDTLAGSASSMPGLSSTTASLSDMSQQGLINGMKNNTGLFAIPNRTVQTWGRTLKAYKPIGWGTGNNPYTF